MKKKHNVMEKGDNGSLLLEFALALPTMFFFFSLLCQLSHVMLAKQVLCYAAASAARSALVYPSGDEAKKAAKEAAVTVLSSILRDQDSVVTVSIDDAENGGKGMFDGDVILTLTYEFPLLIPMAGAMVSQFSTKKKISKEHRLDPIIGWTGGQNSSGSTGFPCMVMSETCAIVKPYSTKAYPKSSSRKP